MPVFKWMKISFSDLPCEFSGTIPPLNISKFYHVPVISKTWTLVGRCGILSLTTLMVYSSTQDTFGQGFFPDPSLPSQKGRGYNQTRHCPASITWSKPSELQIHNTCDTLLDCLRFGRGQFLPDTYKCVLALGENQELCVCSLYVSLLTVIN